MKKIVMIVAALLLIFTLASCAEDNGLDDGGKTPTENQNVLLELTLTELAMYNGKDGNKAYIAINDDIYDVSDVWISGEHNGYNAGTDVTNFITSAPHGNSVLDDLEIVGMVVTE